jgi:hypothetical protein
MNYKLPIIEKYLQKHFPSILKVEFSKTQSYLGSSFDLPKEERTITKDVIEITFDNLKGNLSKSELSELRSEIWNTLSREFGLQIEKYGSKYNLEFFVAATIKYSKYQGI